jgi:uroporphyrinogen-III synthase
MPDHVERLTGSIALVQSARSGAWLGELVDAHGLARSGIALVAVSASAAAAAGTGWAHIVVPGERISEALIDAAIALAD